MTLKIKNSTEDLKIEYTQINRGICLKKNPTE